MSSPKATSTNESTPQQGISSAVWWTSWIPTATLIDINDMASSLWLQQQRLWDNIHPGHASVLLSLPFCYHAYIGYGQSLEDMVQSVLKQQQHLPLPLDASQWEDSVRRSLATAVATRALKVATTGCLTLHEAMVCLRSAAHRLRWQWEEAFLWESPPRVDERHPEYQKVQQMTEEEELDYIYKTYFPQDEIWDPSSSTLDDGQEATIDHPKNA